MNLLRPFPTAAAGDGDEDGAAVQLPLPLRHARRACEDDAPALQSQLWLATLPNLPRPVIAGFDLRIESGSTI
jgi:hypothetical protein